MLAQYCVACAIVEGASDYIAQHGTTVTKQTLTPDGYVTEYKDHPAVARLAKYMAECRKIERVLGITASARAELGAALNGAPRTKEDELSEKFG